LRFKRVIFRAGHIRAFAVFAALSADEQEPYVPLPDTTTISMALDPRTDPFEMK
jgi:hypothetical protein